jgi:hypothetical protein
MSGFRPSEQLALPDLRVFYVDAAGTERSIDIEADVRYREKTVADKVSAYVAGGSEATPMTSQSSRADNVSASIADAFSWTETLFRDSHHSPMAATESRISNVLPHGYHHHTSSETATNGANPELPGLSKEAGQPFPSSGMAWVTKSVSQATRVASVLRTKAQDERMLGKLRGIFILIMDEHGNLKRFRW